MGMEVRGSAHFLRGAPGIFRRQCTSSNAAHGLSDCAARHVYQSYVQQLSYRRVEPCLPPKI
eukprot:33974-Eustigmatos_ZCMA.PRE.1